MTISVSYILANPIVGTPLRLSEYNHVYCIHIVHGALKLLALNSHMVDEYDPFMYKLLLLKISVVISVVLLLCTDTDIGKNYHIGSRYIG